MCKACAKYWTRACGSVRSRGATSTAAAALEHADGAVCGTLGARMRIREIERRDIDAVAALERRCFGDAALPQLALRQQFDLFKRTSFVVEGPRGGGPVIGYVFGGVCGDPRNEGWILGIAVDPAHRAGGVAEALLAPCVARLRDLRVDTIWATTHPANAGARRLFSKVGFDEVARDEAYFGAGEPRVILCARSG